MQAIIAKLNEAYESCLTLQKDLEAKVATNSGLSAELSKEREELSSLEKSLSARESAVEGIENLVQLKSEAKTAKEEAEKALAELAVQRNAFADTESRVNAELSQKATEAEALLAKAKKKNEEADARLKGIESQIKEGVEKIVVSMKK